MNYTKLVREYCKNNSGAIFDVSKLKDTEFAEVQYKTLLKILNRLEEEGLLKPVSKGVYFIGEKPVDEELIFDEYVNDGKGMFAGYQLFNDVGISDYFDCKIEIYTNNIKAKQKSVGRYLLKRVDLEFDDYIVDLVALLEIIDIGYSMKGCDFMAYKKTVDMLLKSYSDSGFEKIIKAIRYKYSTIKQLSELLEANSIDNNCVDIFESTYYVVPENKNFNGKSAESIKTYLCEKLKQCDVLLCLVGQETYRRPHVDHEIHTALKGNVGERLGIVGVHLPKREDNLQALDLNTFPTKLWDNKEYVVWTEWGDLNNDIIYLVQKAYERSMDAKYQTTHRNSCMPLRQSLYYDN